MEEENFNISDSSIDKKNDAEKVLKKEKFNRVFIQNKQDKRKKSDFQITPMDAASADYSTQIGISNALGRAGNAIGGNAQEIVDKVEQIHELVHCREIRIENKFDKAAKDLGVKIIEIGGHVVMGLTLAYSTFKLVQEFYEKINGDVLKVLSYSILEWGSRNIDLRINLCPPPVICKMSHSNVVMKYFKNHYNESILTEGKFKSLSNVYYGITLYMIGNFVNTIDTVLHHYLIKSKKHFLNQEVDPKAEYKYAKEKLNKRIKKLCYNKYVVTTVLYVEKYAKFPPEENKGLLTPTQIKKINGYIDEYQNDISVQMFIKNSIFSIIFEALQIGCNLLKDGEYSFSAKDKTNLLQHIDNVNSFFPCKEELTIGNPIRTFHNLFGPKNTFLSIRYLTWSNFFTAYHLFGKRQDEIYENYLVEKMLNKYYGIFQELKPAISGVVAFKVNKAFEYFYLSHYNIVDEVTLIANEIHKLDNCYIGEYVFSLTNIEKNSKIDVKGFYSFNTQYPYSCFGDLYKI